MTLNNVNEATGQRGNHNRGNNATAQWPALLHDCGRAKNDFNSFQSAFRNILRSVQLND